MEATMFMVNISAFNFESYTGPYGIIVDIAVWCAWRGGSGATATQRGRRLLPPPAWGTDTRYDSYSRPIEESRDI